MNVLTAWDNFYVVIGSAAGALIGLQFVLITLIAYAPVGDGGEQAGHAFATPTIVHFGAALTLAGIGTAPWHSSTPVAVLWGGLGGFGVVYTGIVVKRFRQQNLYKPQFEDWLTHVLLPLIAYGCIAFCALITSWDFREALFAVGAAALLLLFIGIHNAWDAATYHVFVVKKRKDNADRAGAKPSNDTAE